MRVPVLISGTRSRGVLRALHTSASTAPAPLTGAGRKMFGSGMVADPVLEIETRKDTGLVIGV